jgi:hypothetical protein
MGLLNILFRNKSSANINTEFEDNELFEILNDRQKLFFKHMDLQYPKLSIVPSNVIMAYKYVIADDIERIIKEIMIAESERMDREIKVFNEKFGLYILVSILLKSKDEAVKYYESISDEPGFGYIQFMSEHFYNNWPNSKLNHFLHIIIIRDSKSGIFQIHTAAGDYGGSPRGKRTYMVFPIDIMNQKEKNIVFKN